MALTPRGYIKTVGGVKRMRWVRPPNSADTLTLAQNQVVFDSANANVYGIFLSGIWSGTIPAGTGTPLQIASFTSPGYVPLVKFWYTPSGFTTRIYPMLYTGGDEYAIRMEASTTGIFLDSGPSATGSIGGIILRYIAFRMPC